MRKIITSLTLIAALAISPAFAQTNLNFESWTANEPNNWASSNTITQAGSGSQTIFKETTNPIQGSSSVKMVTGNCPNCPNFSVFGPSGIVTPLPNPMGGTIELGSFHGVGVSYTSRPISVDFSYKANPMGSDAAGIWVKLTKTNNDEIITIGEGYFKVNALVTNWTTMNIPIAYYSNDTPENLDIWATSSIGSVPDFSATGFPPTQGIPTPVAGSEFYLDAIVLNLPSCAGLTSPVSGTNETSTGANDGTANANASGGTAPYTYLWSNLSSTPTINGLAPGIYSVTVTDANGCVKVGSYNVTPAGCNLSVAVTGTNSTTTSISSGDGTATATVSGGNPPYTYLWNTGASLSSISELAVGTYSVVVREENNTNPTCEVWSYYTVYGDAGGSNGINEETTKNTFSVYPNPTNGVFQIKFETKIATKSVLEVYNSFGQKVYTTTNLQQEMKIDLYNYSKGIYFIKIDDSSEIYTQKVIVQ
jgi:hypothetical protein